MERQLKSFVEAHPDGWHHAQWLGLLAELARAGVDTSDPRAIGAELERANLAWQLRRRAIPGLGPKRIDALVTRFGTLWHLRQADAAEIASSRSIPMALAERVVEALG